MAEGGVGEGCLGDERGCSRTVRCRHRRCIHPNRRGGRTGGCGPAAEMRR
jgi:hypothetical protein